MIDLIYLYSKLKEPRVAELPEGIQMTETEGVEVSNALIALIDNFKIPTFRINNQLRFVVLFLC